MKLRLMLTTLVTILFLATACTEEPAPAPDTKETDRLSRQIQELKAENETVRNELATLTAAGSEQQQIPVTETPENETPTAEISKPTPDEPKAKPSRPTENICDRSPAAQELLLEKLSFSMCSAATGEELFRIEGLAFRGDLWAGDLNDLVNLKSLQVEILEGSLPENIFADLVNLEGLYIDIENDNDEPWSLDGMLTGNAKLRGLAIETSSEQPITLTKETLEGLQELERISIKGITSLNEDAFAGLKSLKAVELNATSTSGQLEGRKPTFPANMIRNTPDVEQWNISNFRFPRVIPYASLEQFCRIGQIAGGNEDTEHQFNGEKMVRVSKDNGVCRIGTGEPDSNGSYPESQIKIVDGRPQADP